MKMTQIKVNENLVLKLQKSPFAESKQKPYILSLDQGGVFVSWNELRAVDLEILAYEILDYVKGK